MIEKLKMIAEKHIEANKENPDELKKYKIIKKILNQKDCFFNISIEYAYSILRDLQIPENEIKNIYIKLITLNKNK